MILTVRATSAPRLTHQRKNLARVQRVGLDQLSVQIHRPQELLLLSRSLRLGERLQIA